MGYSFLVKSFLMLAYTLTEFMAIVSSIPGYFEKNFPVMNVILRAKILSAEPTARTLTRR